ncbi:3'-5' exonuclease [Peptostreptococcus anaerobius]|uniref:3'-5' exonuclease n=1 Tax=Peptostreptococcus porci TaxID=2652282 RepID=A0A6N7XEU9_9FIRM|nr:3'-5' exonuclease [Peptostreptococcus porci]MST62113.1 3'-5' exonuclease [Peptostreptococcus porci]
MSFIIGPSKFSTYLPNKYVVIDLEATGNSKFNYIIELSAIKIVNNEIIDEFNHLIKPPDFRYIDDTSKVSSFSIKNGKKIFYIDSFIEKLTGIDNKMIDNAIQESIVIKKFHSFIQDNVIVGHGMANDINLLNKAYNRVLGIDFVCSFVDTFELALIIDNAEYSLVNLCNKFGIDNKIVHRARSDAYRTYLCYEKLKKIINDDSVAIFREGFDNKINSMIASQKNNMNRKRIKKFNGMNWSRVKNFLESVGNLEDILYEENIFVSNFINDRDRKKIEDIVEYCGGNISNTIDDNTGFFISNFNVDMDSIDFFTQVYRNVFECNSSSFEHKEKNIESELNSEIEANIEAGKIYDSNSQKYDEFYLIYSSILKHNRIKVMSFEEMINSYDLGYNPNLVFDESLSSMIYDNTNNFYLYLDGINESNVDIIKKNIIDKGGHIKETLDESVEYIVLGKKDNTFINSNEFIKFIFLISTGSSIFIVNEARFEKKSME